MSKVELDEYWQYLINSGIATEEELQLVTYIIGYSVETLDKVLYARTGYRSIEQLEGLDK
jgi:hypothetical protein